MREVVDKHFADNWVLSYYMGLTADLSDVWVSFKAANAAIKNIVQKSIVADLTEKHRLRVPKLIEQLKQYLTKGMHV